MKTKMMRTETNPMLRSRRRPKRMPHTHKLKAYRIERFSFSGSDIVNIYDSIQSVCIGELGEFIS
jgi:hypothetical protein